MGSFAFVIEICQQFANITINQFNLKILSITNEYKTDFAFNHKLELMRLLLKKLEGLKRYNEIF